MFDSRKSMSARIGTLRFILLLNSDYSMFTCIQTRLQARPQQLQLLPAVHQAKWALSGQRADATWPTAAFAVGRGARRRLLWFMSASSQVDLTSSVHFFLGIPPSRLGMTRAQWMTETRIQITNACKYAHTVAPSRHTQHMLLIPTEEGSGKKEESDVCWHRLAYSSFKIVDGKSIFEEKCRSFSKPTTKWLEMLW